MQNFDEYLINDNQAQLIDSFVYHQIFILINLYNKIALQLQQMMQNQKIEPNQTHNLLITTFLPTQQIKFFTYVKLQCPKSIFFNRQEAKYVTGLAIATVNTIKLYAIYKDSNCIEVGSWRLHEDIQGLISWNKILVVHTSNKIIGLKYQGGYLKNCFMLSLQFLHIDDLDSCKVYGDKLGSYLIIYIKNYLIVCLSQEICLKYKNQVFQRPKMKIIQQDVKWNQPNTNYIKQIIKIRISQFDIFKIENIQLIDEYVYFVGQKGAEINLYLMQISNFLDPRQNLTIFKPIHIIEKDQLCHAKNIFITNPKECLYFNDNTKTLMYKSQQLSQKVISIKSQFELVTSSVPIFPIFIWQESDNQLLMIQKPKIQGNPFIAIPILNDHYLEKFIYNREGIITLLSKTKVYLLQIKGAKELIHSSLGNIIDFHIGKDMLLIENYEKKLTKLYELTKGPRVDPKPFVTHKKKTFLEGISDLSAIFSLNTSRKKLQILGVCRRFGNTKLYTFYRQNNGQFQIILQEVKDYQEAKFKNEDIIILKTKEDKGKIVLINQQIQVIDQFQWDGWKMPRYWCIGEQLIAHDLDTWKFYNLSTKRYLTFSLQIEKADFISSFVQFRTLDSQRNTKDHQLVQIYLCYKQMVQIWLLNLQTSYVKKIFESKMIVEGLPILTNQIGMLYENSNKDRYRSISSPQYTIIDYGIKQFQTKKNLSIIASYLYEWQKKTLFIFITSQDQIILYKKYFNIEDGGFMFRRINTPLNIVKNFKWGNDKSFVDLGEGIIKFGNFLLYKGQILESIVAKSLFYMDGSLWGLLNQGKIRLIHLGSNVYEGFCIRQIQSSQKQQMMGIQSTSQFYCIYSRKSFEIFSKEFNLLWKCNLGNENIVCLKLFEHYVGMSYYDYYTTYDGVNDYNSIRFRFRIYNCATKNKIVERQKPLDQPILHIRFIAPDKLFLVTSSVIFMNVLKNDKTLEPYRTHNFQSKRSFLSAFAYIPDILATNASTQSRPGFMLFGGSHGGLGFYVGKWIEQQKLKQQWFEGFRCGMRQISFFHIDQQKQLNALIADEDGNLVVLALKNNCAKKIADVRLGSLINSFKTKPGNQKVVYCSMSDGSIKTIASVKLDNAEVSYLDFQKIFCRELPFIGGFCLRTSRQLLQKYRSSSLISQGNIVDCDILQLFFSLTNSLQQYIIEESQTEYSSLKSILQA